MPTAVLDMKHHRTLLKKMSSLVFSNRGTFHSSGVIFAERYLMTLLAKKGTGTAIEQTVLQQNRGRWKPYEDEMLTKAVLNNKDSNGNIVWSNVRAIMKGTRSYQQCLDRWTKHLRFIIENEADGESSVSRMSAWTQEEDERLQRAMQLCQYETSKGKKKVDWNLVLEHFKGKRTYLQCYLRWYQVLHSRIRFKSGTWTESEDEKLREIFASSKDPKNPDWSSAPQILARSTKQCRRRWEALTTRGECNVGRWSPEEDKQLRAAIRRQIGDNFQDLSKVEWNEVSKRIISRSPLQCRSRAWHYESLSNKNPWSENEDELLKQLTSEYATRGTNGGIMWEAVSKRMPGRGAYQCRNRWFEHVKLGGRRRRGYFSQEEDEKLIRIVKETTITPPEAPGQFWQKVGESFGPTRSHRQCRRRWKYIHRNAADPNAN